MKDSYIEAEMKALRGQVARRDDELKRIEAESLEAAKRHKLHLEEEKNRRARTSLLDGQIVYRQKRLAELQEHKEFNEHLRRASKVVAGWPDWKQNLLGKPTPAERLARGKYVKRTRAEVEKDRCDFAKKFNEGLAKLHADFEAVSDLKDRKVKAKEKPKLTVWTRDISDEPKRKYEWVCPVTGKEAEVTIVNPLSVSFHKGCTTHKVTKKNGTIIYVPAPGVFGCIVVVE